MGRGGTEKPHTAQAPEVDAPTQMDIGRILRNVPTELESMLEEKVDAEEESVRGVVPFDLTQVDDPDEDEESTLEVEPEATATLRRTRDEPTELAPARELHMPPVVH